jgi:hypothetical protein
MRIVIGGQVEREALADLVKTIGGDRVEVSVKNDIEAAMAVKTGAADYYLGACHTGAAAPWRWPSPFWACPTARLCRCPETSAATTRSARK